MNWARLWRQDEPASGFSAGHLYVGGTSLGEGDREFAVDSLLEGRRFELSVPPTSSRRSEGTGGGFARRPARSGPNPERHPELEFGSRPIRRAKSKAQADGVAAIRIDIAAGSVYLRSCPSGTQSTSAPPLDFSEIGIIPPGLKRMLGASHAIRSGGQPCSPRARRSRHGPARS